MLELNRRGLGTAHSIIVELHPPHDCEDHRVACDTHHGVCARTDATLTI
jgi:hypothetical protein